jgi:hypothetical protein
METSTNIIGLFLILIIVLPIALLLKNQNNSSKRINQILHSHGNGSSKSFTERDAINNKIVAFDPNQKILVLIDQNTKPETVTAVDLNAFDKASIIRKSEPSQVKDRNEITTQVEILLEKQGTEKKERLLFYNFEYERPIQITYYRDNQLAEKWLAIIQQSIT